MREVGIKQAKTELSQLFEQALAGEVVLISRNGKERVQLTPYLGPDAKLSGFGEWRDKLKGLPDDYWDNPEHDADVARLLLGVDLAAE